jgi:rhamnose transport system permease protein
MMLKDTNNSSILNMSNMRLKSLLKVFFARSEVSTFFLMVGVLVLILIIEPNYRDTAYIVKALSRNVEFGIVALMMSFIIIAGMMDLSVASIMTLSTTITALLYHYAGIPMWLAVIIGLISGFAQGLLNGALVAYFKIVSVIVTIGTLALYRGISQIFIGDHSLGDFPKWFNAVDRIFLFKIGNTGIPVTLIGLLVMVIVMFLILKFTTIGRKIYAIGTNEVAALHSGVNVKRLKLLLFGFSGLFAAAAGMLNVSRFLVVRYDMAIGGELDIIIICMLGGISIAGGKGNIIGTLWGILMVTFIRSGLSVAGVGVDLQLFWMGALLVAAIGVPQVILILRDKYQNKRVQREIDRDSIKTT